jgi:hypothetical protein
VNLLAVALNSRVWTLDTAWDSLVHSAAPRPFSLAFRRAMSRVPMSAEDIRVLQDGAQRLGVELRIID